MIIEIDAQTRLYYAPDHCLFCSDDRRKRTHKHTPLREQEDRFYLLACGAPSCAACTPHKEACLKIESALLKEALTDEQIRNLPNWLSKILEGPTV